MMSFFTHFAVECKRLLDLNEFIHNGTELFNYHMNHIDLVRRYATLLNRKLLVNINIRKLEYIALAHDLFKERSLNKEHISVNWRGHQVPQDTNRYVRLNLQVLEEYGLDEYFNTDVQLHPLAAGIFLIKEFGINDKEILYPIMFHSCPIITIYERLDLRTRYMIDIVMLSDKLSSNYLKINNRNKKVRIDLDKAVFGALGNELNYTMGLFLARLISQGESKGEHGILATEYYHKRLNESNPLIPKKYSLRGLGGSCTWPKRNSQAWKMP